MSDDKLRAQIEALLFASGDPVSGEKMAKILNVAAERVEDVVFELKEELSGKQHGITIRQIAGGYQMCTKKELVNTVNKLALGREVKLSAPLLETLAIIAFRQPVTRQEIEFIRGVRPDRILNNLLEMRLIKEAGRKDAVGRPILYATTKEFLALFGLNSLLDLPKLPDKVFPSYEEVLTASEGENLPRS
jgi:segregation and condensation protein B